MPTGKPPALRRWAGGYTYLGLLALLALLGAVMAGIGQRWSTQTQRENERELIFRGEEIRSAVQSYLRASAGSGQAPGSFDDLLNDRRGTEVRHHLRRLYHDPFTGRPDWALIPHPDQPGRFIGVRSRSQVQALREVALPGLPAGRTCVCAWPFQADTASTPFDIRSTPFR